MRAVFLATKQSVNAVAAWAASLQASGASLRHVAAWSGADELGRRQNGSACNVDGFLLGPGASLESHLAQYCSSSSGGSGGGDGLLLVSLEPSPHCLPRAGVVVLLWQPQVPADIVQACSALPPCLADAPASASPVRGILLVDPSPSLTLSVTHKALEGAGLHTLARKPTLLAARTVQAPGAALAALAQLAEPLPLAAAAPPLALSPGAVRIAVARDDAFGPCFHENLTLLHQSGAQLLSFSPLYDSALPAGATCLYLSSGPLEPERWQQLAANRPLLAAVKAFCEAGGMVLAEGAGLLYLSRTVELDEDGDGVQHKHCVHDMADVLPFKTRLLSEPQAAPVQLHVTAGNPLLPAGSRPRGYLSAQASIAVVEERQLQSLVLLGPLAAAGGGGGAGLGPGKGSGPPFSTTYEVTVVQQQAGKDGELAAAAPEGYALHNVLASSCLLFLPSEPGLTAHWLRRCACIDAAALAASMAQQLGAGAVATAAASVAKLHYPGSAVAALGSAACSRAGSRRQSIQELSALAAGYTNNGGSGAISSGSSSSMLMGLSHTHNNHHNHQLVHHNHHHLNGTQQYYHQPQTNGSPLQASGCAAQQCVEPGCGGLCGNNNNPRQPSKLSHSSSATGASGLGLSPPPQPHSHPRRSLCGPTGFAAPGPWPLPPLDSASGCVPSRSPHPHPQPRSPYASPLPPTPPGHSGRCSPVGWKDGGAVESPGLLRPGWPAQEGSQQQLLLLQQQRPHGYGMQGYGSDVSLSSYSAASASGAQDNVRRKPATAVYEPEAPPATAVATVDTPAAAAGGPISPERAGEGACCAGAAECCADGYFLAPAGVVRGAAASCSPCGGVGIGAGANGAFTRAAAMHATGSACSLTGYAGHAAGSSCSLSELPYQRRTNCGRPEEPGGPDYSPGYGVGVGARHAGVMLLGPLGAGGAAGHQGGVVCCAPGACEALVAMGLANRLAAIGVDCDHPPDVCASRRVVLSWVPAEEAPQGAAARGIRVVLPGGARHGGGAGGGAAATGQLAVVGGCRRGGRASAERGGGGAHQRGGGGGAGGRALLVDELALRQEPPAVLVLPDAAELSEGELTQLEQGLVETGLMSASGGPGGTCTVLHVRCRTLVDVMDLLLELGAALDETAAASMLLERLQARLRRVVAAAAAAAASPVRLLPMAAAASAGATAGAASQVAAAAAGAAGRRPRVLVLQSLQPLVEPGRWVPEMLALAGASSCLALPGGPDVQLTWQELRERAAPDVLVVLTSPGSGSGGADAGVSGGTAGPAAGGPGQGLGLGLGSGLQEQLAAMASQPGWWCLPAVRVSQVYLLQAPYVVRPGPRLVDGAELLARLLLPGQYSSSRKVPAGAVMRLSLAAGQRCRATLLPSYFVPVTF